jgi:hypothetical protein
MSEKRVLRRSFGFIKEEGIRMWKILHSQEHNFS